MENDTDKQPPPPEETPLTPSLSDEENVDLAIAALGNLAELTQIDDTDESLTEAFADGDSMANDDMPERSALPKESPHPAFILPPLSYLERGQSGSVLPALGLMGVGAFLTFMFTTSDTPPEPLSLFVLGVCLLGAIFIGYWVSSGRWSVGNFFVGAWLLLSAGVFFFTTQTNIIRLENGYPLFISAFGVAMVLTTWLTPFRGQRLGALGFAMMIAGIIGTIWTAGLI